MVENQHEGFDFNTDKDGIWFEGTAQMALAYRARRDMAQANRLINTLRTAQLEASNSDGLGIVSASRDNLTTGFDWKYFKRLHLGATAWYLLAEQGFNPYSRDSANDTENNGGSGPRGSNSLAEFWLILMFLLLCIHLVRRNQN